MHRTIAPAAMLLAVAMLTSAAAGQDVAFTSSEDGTARLNILSAGRSRVVKTDLAYAEAPSWSPDSTQLFFHGRVKRNSPSNIYVVTIASGKVIRLTGDHGHNEFPVVSPDGTTIAFMSTGDDHKTESYDVYLMDRRGRNVRRFTQAIDESQHPSWSPDSEFIAFSGPAKPRPRVIKDFSQFDPSSVFTDIYVAKSDGTQLKRITKSDAMYLFPRWSPNGKRIAFASNLHGDTANLGDLQIYSMNLNGNSVQQLTRRISQNVCPSWSPSGEQIIFHASPVPHTTKNTSELVTINLQSGKLRVIHRAGQNAYFPAWRPTAKAR